MRLSRRWLRPLIAATAILGACAPAERDYHHEILAFGTYVSVTFYAVTEEQSRIALAQLEALFRDVDADWYPWAPGELQRVNAAIAAGERIAVSERLASLMRAATAYEQQSQGRFNAGLGHLIELWGLHDMANPLTRIPNADELAALHQTAPSLHSLSWQGFELSSSNPELMIDLGGIAKGAILEESQILLRAIGIDNAIVNIGGDLIVIGRARGRAVRIGIRSPLSDTPLARVVINDGESVITSGSYERFVEIDGTRYTHILNPISGLPVAHTVSVTVVDDDPVLADAAATALMVGGAGEFDMLVEALNLEYALLIEAGGDTRLTPGMRERLQWIDQP